MKIIYCIAGFYRPAGMERVLADKANWLARHGYEVIIVTTDQRGRKPVFELDPSVRLVDLGVNYESNNGSSFASKLFFYPFKKRLHRRRLERLLMAERPDIVDSMFCGEESFLPRIKDGSRKVLEVHFSRFKRLQYGRKGLWALADRWRSGRDLLNASRFDKFVVLTKEDSSFWTGLENLTVIGNASPFTFQEPASLDTKTVIAVGRYSPQKALDRLVEAWRKVRLDPASDGWKLWLVGDGEEREALESQIISNSLTDSVILGRNESDMRNVYLSASILALSSRYEGLPMALIESQSAGVPAVSFDCQCGPKDIITDGLNGFLVPEGDIDSLADRIIQLIKDDDLRRNMGSAAYVLSSRFSEDKIMQQWTSLFEELL